MIYYQYFLEEILHLEFCWLVTNIFRKEFYTLSFAMVGLDHGGAEEELLVGGQYWKSGGSGWGGRGYYGAGLEMCWLCFLGRFYTNLDPETIYQY